MQMRFKNKCLIIHEGRCGSTLLSDKINNKTRIHLGELLEPGVWVGKNFQDSKLKSIRDESSLKYDDFFEFLADASRLHHKYGKLLDEDADFSVELKVNHISGLKVSYKKLIEDFLEKGFKIIFLYRENSLRRTLSFELAQQSGVWHKRKTGDKQMSKDTKSLNPHQVYCPYFEASPVDLNFCLNSSLDFQNYISMMSREIGFSTLTFYDLIKNNQKFLEIIQKVLMVEKIEVSNLIPTNYQKRLENILENFHEIENFLLPHFKWMLQKESND